MCLDGHLRWLRGHFLLILYRYDKALNREKELNPSQDPCHWSLVRIRFARIFVSPYSLVKSHVGLKLLEIFGNSILPQSHPTVTGSIPVCKNVCFPQVNQVAKVIKAYLMAFKLSCLWRGSNQPKIVNLNLIQGCTSYSVGRAVECC
jgi:hypothetical protein